MVILGSPESKMSVRIRVETRTELHSAPSVPHSHRPLRRCLLGCGNTVKVSFSPQKTAFQVQIQPPKEVRSPSPPKQVRVFSCGNCQPGLSGNIRTSAQFRLLDFPGVQWRTQASLWGKKNYLLTKCFSVVQREGHFRTCSGNPSVLTRPIAASSV